MKIPSIRPSCVFRFNSTEMASLPRYNLGGRYDHSPSWTYFLFLQFSPSSILSKSPALEWKQAWLGGYTRTCFACPSTGYKRDKGNAEADTRGCRWNGFHHGQQRNHDFHRVSNSAHGRAHARTFSSLALRRPLNLYRDRDDRNKVRVHPVPGDFRGEIWKCDYVAGLNSKFGIWNENWCREILFIPLWIRLEN